jgi:hypothetical protein
MEEEGNDHLIKNDWYFVWTVEENPILDKELHG